MHKPWLSKEKLIQYLLIVSIISISIIGFYFLQLLTKDLLLKVFQAINAVLIPFVIAFFLSFIIGPLSQFIHKKLHIKQSISIILSILLGLLLLFIIFASLVYFVVTQLQAIINSLLSLVDNQSISEIVREILTFIQDYFASSDISDWIHQLTTNGASIERIIGLATAAFVSLSRVASSIVSVVLLFVLTPVFLFYLVKEKSYIFENISKIFPRKMRSHIIELGKRSDNVIRNYFKGQGLMIVIIFAFFAVTLGVLSFFIPHFPLYYAIIFAMLMGLMNIIPYVGAWIGLFAPLIFLFTKHLELQQTEGNIYLIAIVIVILLQLIEQALEGSVIQPNVMGKQVHIHPLAILSSLLFFGGVFGLPGVLLAVPLVGTIKASIAYLSELNDIESKRVVLPSVVDKNEKADTKSTLFQKKKKDKN